MNDLVKLANEMIRVANRILESQSPTEDKSKRKLVEVLRSVYGSHDPITARMVLHYIQDGEEELEAALKEVNPHAKSEDDVNEIMLSIVGTEYEGHTVIRTVSTYHSPDRFWVMPTEVKGVYNG